MSVRPRMTHLFEQLGLDASEEAIALFIVTHQLNAQTTIAVNPDDRLEALAKEQAWEIQDWSI